MHSAWSECQIPRDNVNRDTLQEVKILGHSKFQEADSSKY